MKTITLALMTLALIASAGCNDSNMTAWGLVQPGADVSGVPDEISLYSSEGYYVKDCRLRRFTLRHYG